MKQPLLTFHLAVAIVLGGCGASCSFIHGDRAKGTYTMAAVGTDLAGYAQTPDGAVVESINNSAAFRELNRTIRFGLGAAAAKSVAGNALNAWKSASNAKTAANLEAAKSANAVKMHQADLDAAAASAVP